MHLRLLYSLSSLSLALLACGPSLRPETVQVASVPAAGLVLSPDSLPEWQFPAELPAGWQGYQSLLPDESAMNFSGDPGTDIVAGKQDAEALVTPWTHQGIALSFRYLCLAGAQIHLQLTPAYTLLFSADREADTPAGSIFAENVMVAKAKQGVETRPGLWQQVSLVYSPPITDAQGLILRSASLSEVTINGTVVHDLVLLPGTDAEPAPLRWMVLKGSAALGGIAYGMAKESPETLRGLLSNQPRITLNNIRYEYTEANYDHVPPQNSLRPVKTGTVSMFSPEAIATRPNDYVIWYEADFSASLDAEYLFSTVSDDGTLLYVNGQLVVNNDGNHGMEEKSGKIFLQAGTHRLRMGYYQGGGGGGLEVYYGSTYFEKQPLATPARKASQRPPENSRYELVPEGRALLQRGFVAYPFFDPENSTNRRTHTIAVGDPTGVHFVYDMESGTLLQAWLGRFVDVRSMWDNRGEQQTAIPLTAPLNPSAGTGWAWLESPSQVWPDTMIDQGLFQFQQYQLDPAGRPTFSYRWGQAQVTDVSTPTEGQQLTREIMVSGKEKNLYLALAKGRQIHQLESDGSYLVEGPSFRLRVLQSEGWEYVLQSGENGQLLLAHPTSSKARLRYSLMW